MIEFEPEAGDRQLADRVDRLTFGRPVTHVYNPLRYAAALHEAYAELAATRPTATMYAASRMSTSCSREVR